MGDYYVNEPRGRSASPSGWQQIEAAGIVWLLLGLPMLVTVLIFRIVLELLARLTYLAVYVAAFAAYIANAWHERRSRSAA